MIFYLFNFNEIKNINININYYFINGNNILIIMKKMNNKENIDDDLNVKKEILWIKTNKIKLIRLKNS